MTKSRGDRARLSILNKKASKTLTKIQKHEYKMSQDKSSDRDLARYSVLKRLHRHLKREIRRIENGEPESRSPSPPSERDEVVDPTPGRPVTKSTLLNWKLRI